MLCRLLQDEHGLDVTVLLPKHGDGTRLLKDAGLKYTVIRSEDWIVRSDESIKGKVRKHFFINRVNIPSLKEIIRYMRQEDFNLVHINTSYSYVAALAAHRLGIPVVWHIREFLEEDQSRSIVSKRFGLDLIRRSDAIIAISDGIQKKYSTHFKNNLIRIYNGISIDEFYKPSKQVFTDNKVKLMCVGTLEEYKGQGLVIEAMHQLLQTEDIDIELWLVGNCKTAYADSLRRKVSDYGMSDRVYFMGRRQDVADLYEKADITCVCSKSEAFGRTTVEAMMSGNLVIGSDSAGTKELIDDGVDGVLFKTGDAMDLASKLKTVLTNRESYSDIADAGRSKAVELYNSRRNAEEVYEAYLGIWGCPHADF